MNKWHISTLERMVFTNIDLKLKWIKYELHIEERFLRWESMNLCNIIVPIAWLLEELNMSFVTKITAPIQSIETYRLPSFFDFQES